MWAARFVEVGKLVIKFYLGQVGKLAFLPVGRSKDQTPKRVSYSKWLARVIDLRSFPYYSKQVSQTVFETCFKVILPVLPVYWVRSDQGDPGRLMF